MTEYKEDKLNDLELPEGKYNQFKNSCIKNKSNSCWIYFYNPDIRRRVMYHEKDDVLIYNGRFKGEWGRIVMKTTS